MRVAEPHHNGTPHWHMMLFCKPEQRKHITEIMRRYALKEDGDEKGAAAVTAWASTWRIPQFKSIGLPTMGAYRELRKLPRGVSIADEFDERVEATRAAADEGEFDLYIAAQGGANVPRDSQTVRVARNVTDEVNAYEEDIERVVGIYVPHLGSELIHVTRTAEWRIVPKLLAVEPLTLKSGIAAPRSPVNNCGLGGLNNEIKVTPAAPEHSTTVLNLLCCGDFSRSDNDMKVGLSMF